MEQWEGDSVGRATLELQVNPKALGQAAALRRYIKPGGVWGWACVLGSETLSAWKRTLSLMVEAQECVKETRDPENCRWVGVG